LLILSHLKTDLAWLRDQVLTAIRGGDERAAIHESNLIPRICWPISPMPINLTTSYASMSSTEFTIKTPGTVRRTSSNSLILGGWIVQNFSLIIWASPTRKLSKQPTDLPQTEGMQWQRI